MNDRRRARWRGWVTPFFYPIYCTQFHPKLDLAAFCERVTIYPEYIERVVGTSHEEFMASCRDTPESNSLLRRFVKLVFDT